MSQEKESILAAGADLSFEAVIDLMHAEEQAYMEPRRSDLIVTFVGKRVAMPLYSMANPRDFEIVCLDLPNE